MGKATDALDLGAWFIIRTASADTLKVNDGLLAHGFEVWTPIEHRRGKMPRTRKIYDKRFALMPSYCFARVYQIDALLTFAAMPTRDFPSFSVFTFKGGVPLVADDQLTGLREEEARTQRVFHRAKRRDAKGIRFDPGDPIKLTDGPFAGMSGVVEGTQGQYTLVEMQIFGRAFPMKVASLLLLPDVATANVIAAAKAA